MKYNYRKKCINDKFYTKNDIAKKLIDNFNLDDFDLIVEPSAGNGSFSKQIPNCIAFDIEPEFVDIKKQDFLKLKINRVEYDRILIIGNPPFGKQGSDALKFLKKAYEFAHVIGFILPKSFKKESYKNKIPLNLHLILEEDLPKNSFLFNGKDYDVPCVFQIWEVRTYNRVLRKKLKPKTFEFVKKENANVAVRRVGGNAGNAFLDINNKSESSHYFIFTDDPKSFVDKVNLIDWKMKDDTVGPRSISTQEIIYMVESVKASDEKINYIYKLNLNE
jgi:predicted RNA methylase